MTMPPSKRSKEFAKGSLDAVHGTLESLGLGPEDIERSLGWARGRYQRLFDEPGNVSLDDYSALVCLTTVQPLPSSGVSAPPAKLGSAFGHRRLLREDHPKHRFSPGEASDSNSTEVWASGIFELIFLMKRLRRLESRTIARILRSCLRLLYEPADPPIH